MSPYRPGAVASPSEPERTAARPLTSAQICGITVFPVLGTGLSLAGMPVSDVLGLLAGCGTIGAATIVAAGGGRRLLSCLATAAVRAATDADPGLK